MNPIKPLLAGSLLAMPCIAKTLSPQEAVKNFVRDFYSWYVPIALKDHKFPADVIAL
jgi:hypothetical protein